MILSVEKIRALINLGNEWSDDRIERKLKSIEQTIRSYTNNNFQNRHVRAHCAVADQNLSISGYIPGLNTGDTIQISESKYNNGLYVVQEQHVDYIVLDRELFDEPNAMITKVEYPDDVIDCCINLCEWEVKNRSKVGIKSETLSRHSVTYYDQDASNQINGYPVSLLGCLKPYRKARC